MIHYEKHLKDDAYYNDLYDRHTVEDCLEFEKRAFEYNGAKKLSKEAQSRLLELSFYFKTGDRYKYKQETIQKWKQRDRAYDEQYENAVEPQNVRCKFCKEPMELFNKWLNTGIGKEPTVVQFSYRCMECKVAKYFYDNGKSEERIPWKCPKCSREMKVQHKRKGDKIYTKESCSFCGYKNEDVLDLNFKFEPPKEPTREEKIQFEKDRGRFCLSDEKGRNYVQQIENIKQLGAMLKQVDAKSKEEAEKEKIKELTVPQLEAMLKKELTKNGYIKLSFGEPRMGRDVDIDFKVYDKTDRGEYDSRKKLKKSLEILLKGTNWKLMSDGVHYRLGILTGRLKTLEKESPFILDSNGDKIIY